MWTNKAYPKPSMMNSRHSWVFLAFGANEGGSPCKAYVISLTYYRTDYLRGFPVQQAFIFRSKFCTWNIRHYSEEKSPSERRPVSLLRLLRRNLPHLLYPLAIRIYSLSLIISTVPVLLQNQHRLKQETY